MKISIWTIGKANETYIKGGVEEFTKRTSKYFSLEWLVLSPPKNAGVMSETELKKKEAEIIFSYLKQDDFLVALDERGAQFTSERLAQFIEQRTNASTRNLVFLIGGAYGIDESVLLKAKLKWSLSQLTFPHQLVRLILAEQVYRACTILRNEKYHHK